ncbi:MAG: pseudouridine synthase [Myxococcales bacterium]|nr:pseudouridine synthase [Myxococcales bacterium]
MSDPRGPKGRAGGAKPSRRREAGSPSSQKAKPPRAARDDARPPRAARDDVRPPRAARDDARPPRAPRDETPKPSDDGRERLQKFLSRAGVASRRQAEELIRQGMVTVNGETVTEMGVQIDPSRDHVRVDGRHVHARVTNLTVMLNKPKGVVCTKSDPERRKTIYELLPQRYRTLSSIGRLDYNTEGLLLLTSDGALAQRLSHPSFACSKTYHVKFRGDIGAAEIERLRQGIELDGRLTKPAIVRDVRSDSKHQWLEITIREGRNRQIRRMGEAIGHPVLKLKRVAIGGLALGDLAAGEMRALTEEDLALLESAPPRKPPSPRRKARS